MHDGDAWSDSYTQLLFCVQVLMISGTYVRDDGIMHLSGLTRLSRLGLCSLPISDHCLEKLSNLSNLAHLDLRSTDISDSGCKALKVYKYVCASE